MVREVELEMVAAYNRIAKVGSKPEEGTAAYAIKQHSQACGVVAFVFNVTPDHVAERVAFWKRANRIEIDPTYIWGDEEQTGRSRPKFSTPVDVSVFCVKILDKLEEEEAFTAARIVLLSRGWTEWSDGLWVQPEFGDSASPPKMTFKGAAQKQFAIIARELERNA